MITVIILLLLLLLLVLCFSYFAYRIAFYSPNKERDAKPSVSGAQYDPYREVMRTIYYKLKDRPFEAVSITSRDGLKLCGRYYHVKDGAPLDIGFHGYRSSPMTDFSGGSEVSFSLEHNLLLVDQRAHGMSEGTTITFGILERWDCLDWVDFAIERFGPDVQILLYGISMGGATVLMASDLPLPPNVKGIIADCPYSSPMNIICKVSDSMRIPARLVRPFLKLGAWLYGGFRLEETDAAKAVKSSKLPILLIHGETDSFVPCQMSEEVFNARPAGIQRHTFPDADHGISYLADSDRYRKIVTDFAAEVLA